MVGFINDLPHDLVVSFRSTLEEARDADLHLHVIDAADPAFRDQYRVTRAVLADIGAEGHPRLLILNKADKLEASQRDASAAEFRDAVLMSAKSERDVSLLHGRIQAHFESGMKEADFVIP